MPVKIDFIDCLQVSSPDGTSPTTLKMIVGCNSKVFWGGYQDWTNTGGPGSYDDASEEITTVGASQDWYLVDGTDLVKIAGDTGAVSTVTTGGAGQPPTGARIVTLYRNRLVLARTSTDPQNWFMSKVGDYENFDYGSTDDGVSVAVAGNNSDAGKIGDVITCLIPFSDDFLVMGCSDSVWMLRGDPAAGGRLDNLAWGGGIVGPHAFARDPEGHIYYLSRTDLMMLPPGGLPKSISNTRIQKFLSNIDFSKYAVRMAWDPIRQGLWVFFTKAAAAAVVHLFWDQRMDAFTTHSFPNDFGPTAVKSLQGVLYEDRQVLLGGFDGFVRTFDPNWIADDDNNAISSYVDFPPLMLNGAAERGVVSETEIVLGTITPPRVTTSWKVGDNAQQAAAATPINVTATTATGRFLNRERVRGQAGIFRLSNTTRGRTFAFESGAVYVSPAGRTR
jgi:hypothetical protein